MKFKEYLKELNKLAEDYPELADAELVTSSDDEGNYFNRVCYTPSVGVYDDGDWYDMSEMPKPTHICLN